MQAQQVIRPQLANPARLQDARDGLDAQARHAQQHFACGGIHIDRKLPPVRNRPGELRVHVERQHASRGIGHDFVVRKAVKADQPVGLVEPVFAYQRRLAQRQAGGCIGDRTEGRVVDAAQLVGAVERGGGLQNRAVAGGVSADDHLRALAAGRKPRWARAPGIQ